MSEVYFSVDIETDGPIPGENSMLSFGAAAFDEGGLLLDTFSRNLNLYQFAHPDPYTMEFWDRNPEAWVECRKCPRDIKVSMESFVTWVESFNAKPVFVAYPAGFDFMFMYWYMIKFVGRSPFSFSALDMKSYACAILDLPYRKTTKQNMPMRWFGEKNHTHIALDDAIEQGELFMEMRKDAAKR